ncbi:MAG TPA: hypothetical protein VH592_12720 [Gemmataceae bacterium]
MNRFYSQVHPRQWRRTCRTQQPQKGQGLTHADPAHAFVGYEKLRRYEILAAINVIL